MNDRVATAAAALDAVAAPLGLARLESMGEAESGAYRFYSTRLRRGTIFSDYEIALARTLTEWPAAPRRIHEVGGGFGSLCLLLALLGFKSTCLELDARRFAAAEALRDGLTDAFVEIRDGYQLLNERFPLARGALPPTGAMAVITNLVFTTSAGEKAEILAALRDYDRAIIDVDRFLTPCETAGQRAERLAELEAAGLYGAPFLDLGKSACFYRFGSR
ncbi:MAG: hypothetical protein H0X27_10450 [Caulobacteraceae bacterium]|nr:hypothetical protein [Caulobacteraceae bacterium]